MLCYKYMHMGLTRPPLFGWGLRRLWMSKNSHITRRNAIIECVSQLIFRTFFSDTIQCKRPMVLRRLCHLLKTTITSFVSQDSVEMSKIRSLGTMVEWNSQTLISTTTIGEETALRPRKIIMEEGDGGSTFVDWSASRAHSMALTFDGILWVFDQRGWWLKASERNPKTPRHFAMTCLAH